MPGSFIRGGKLYQLYTSSVEYNFWWNCLEPRDKIDQTIRVTIFDIIKQRNHAICLKFGDRFCTSLTMLGL